MGEMVWEGYLFDSSLIDWSVGRYKDRKILWVLRRQALSSEIELSKACLELMIKTTPEDGAGLAHSRAYLSRLLQTQKELEAEPLGKPNP